MKQYGLHIFFMIAGLNGYGQEPVARYSFNNAAAKDEVGSNDARVYNLLPADDRFGNANSAWLFPGNFDSYISLGTGSTVKPRCGSISLWVRIDQQVYRGKGRPSNPFVYTRAFAGEDFNDAFVIAYNFDTKKFHANNSNSEKEQVSLAHAKNAYFRRWYHIVFTYDDHQSCLYIDGALSTRAEKNFETRFLKTDSVILGGQLGKKNNRYFQGLIDDVAFYDRVITPEEVLELYRAPNPNRRMIVIRWVLIGLGTVLCGLIIIWWARKRIRKTLNAEREKNRLNARMLALETKALRTQMNPRFIFNSLSVLDRLAQEDSIDRTYDYLMEFSRLLRRLLESSESEMISLKEEIGILSLYLSLECQNMEIPFDYEVRSDIASPEQVYIPIMLIQPFAEQAIWHGLSDVRGKGRLSIRFSDLDSGLICCEVEDNGLSRGRDNNSAEQTLNMDQVNLRLQLISGLIPERRFVEILDKTGDPGGNNRTIVKLIIPKM